MGQRESAKQQDLSELAPALSHSLLVWWEIHGRKELALKPWMFTKGGRWPDPSQLLDPYGIWIAEVMLHFATQEA